MASLPNGQRNFYVELRDHCERNKLNLEFIHVSSSGPSHDLTFVYRAQIDGKEYPEVSGKSKKEARNSAARKALEDLKLLELQPLDQKNTSDSMVICATPTQSCTTNYVGWLHEYAVKMGIKIDAIETQSGLSHLPNFCCKWKLGDQEYGCGSGKNKKEAKQNAAVLAYNALVNEDNEKHEPIDRSSSQTACSSDAPLEKQDENRSTTANGTMKCFSNVDSSTMSDDSFDGIRNFVGQLNELCQKNKKVYTFEQVEQSGPSHNPVHILRVVMGDKEFPAASGRKKQTARQRAAQLALEQLMYSNSQSDLNHNRSSGASHLQQRSSVSSGISEDRESSSEDSRRRSTGTGDSFIVFRDDPSKKSASSTSSLSHPVNEKDLGTKPPTRKLIPLAAKFPSKATVEPESPTYVHNTPTRIYTDFGDISPLGRGGFGCVFKAKQKIDKKYYAVKKIKLRSNKKPNREVEVLADLQHANIVRYYTAWIETELLSSESDISSSCSSSSASSDIIQKYLYIQMELCEKGSLDVWIAQNVTEIKMSHKPLDIFRQIAGGVEYIHSKELIHRDLKPANIFIAEDNKEKTSIKIGDFGLVTYTAGDPIERTTNKGTRSYMSPEQKSDKQYGSKVDIFPLGLILFQLLWPIKTGNERAKIWESIRQCEFPSQFCKEFALESQFTKKMLAEDPKDRPEAPDIVKTADEFLDHFNKMQLRTI